MTIIHKNATKSYGTFFVLPTWGTLLAWFSIGYLLFSVVSTLGKV